jgi:hypothetical protein
MCREAFDLPFQIWRNRIVTAVSIDKAYSLAKERYAELGVDVDMALKQLGNVAISMQCWQDDVAGFESVGSAAEATPTAKKLAREGVVASSTTLPCWCYGSEMANKNLSTGKPEAVLSGTACPSAAGHPEQEEGSKPPRSPKPTRGTKPDPLMRVLALAVASLIIVITLRLLLPQDSVWAYLAVFFVVVAAFQAMTGNFSSWNRISDFFLNVFLRDRNGT